MIDLHIHTNASSDGQHSPQEIFQMARCKGLRAIAFADHNSVKNVGEGIRLAEEFRIEFIPCLELNTLFNGLELQEWLEEIHHKKAEQARKRLERLNELGFFFTEKDLEAFCEGCLPTGVSFLKAILSHPENRRDPRLRPYIDGDRSISPYVNFYRDYLRGGKPAFVSMEDVSTPEAIRKIKGLGGISILAHPSDTGEENIRALIRSGLEGLEAYSPYHTPEEQGAFRVFAETRGLLVTAGSDFHGKSVKPDVELGQVYGDHYDLISRLREKRKDRP
jgi:predicted metal-dependent phosphoesterase TrpH